ncbi:di-trans,poly-cis-decaprenylcistransferase [Candidatus Amesbacteria bacterium]|nr:di-trans,poly-cis-decaprenylcistransferase [Candidatus Amesbacteria bacterium]
MDKISVPKHIALILDGNRRWARARGLKPWEGHKAGLEAVIEVAKASRDFGVHTFTIWAFSTENWDRSQQEIDKIMDLFDKAMDEFRKDLITNQVRFIHLGRKDRLPAKLVAKMARIEEETKDFDEHTLNLALDYGGKDEIVRATNKILENSLQKVDEKIFESYLDTAGQPYPYVDLFIRTSGEQRTSGLLPWQMSYAEMYWELDHLPDFSPVKLKDAILDYSCRRRRFGGNDKEEHLKFNPKVVAKLDLEWRHALDLHQDEKFRDLIIRYVKEHYGLSKELAKTAGVELAKALVYGKKEDWVEAKKALEGLYEIIGKTLGLALEPKIVASLEVDLWRDGHEERKMRKLLAEKFRFSDLQASKSAHLAFLANEEIVKNNFTKARGYLEKFYEALKERVA